jgi:hypothetical protein
LIPCWLSFCLAGIALIGTAGLLYFIPVASPSVLLINSPESVELACELASSELNILSILTTKLDKEEGVDIVFSNSIDLELSVVNSIWHIL